MFEPDSDVERAMEAAARDPAKVAAIDKVLLESEIDVLTPEAKLAPGRRRALKYRERLQVATVQFQGLRWHPAFTVKSRIAAYVKETETCFGAVAKNMVPLLAGSNPVVQPPVRMPEADAGQRDRAPAVRRDPRDRASARPAERGDMGRDARPNGREPTDCSAAHRCQKG